MNFKPLLLSPLPQIGGVAASWAALAPSQRQLLAQTYVALSAEDALSPGSALAAYLSEALAGPRLENLRALAALRRAAQGRNKDQARAALARMRLDDPAARAEADVVQAYLATLEPSPRPRRTP
jgi:hypothetical protein